MLAGNDLVGGLDDGVGFLVVEEAEVVVRLRGGLLDDAERAHEAPPERRVRDGEVFDGALGLCAPVGVRGNFDFTETVLFDSVVTVLGHI